jgi:hypothetical protein
MQHQQQQQLMMMGHTPQLLQAQQQQQMQQPMLLYMPQSMRQVATLPQHSQLQQQQPQQQQQQVVVVQATAFSNQPQGVWMSQQVLQQVPEAVPMQQAGMVAAALPGTLPAHSGALVVAAMHSAELSSSSYLSPVAQGGGGGSSGGFMSRVVAGRGDGISNASGAMEQLQDQALLMRQDLCKFDSFTSQGAAPGSFTMRPAQQQALLQQLQLQQQQQQQPMAPSIASLESYMRQMTLAGVQQQQQQQAQQPPGLLVQQEGAMFGSFTSQGGSSGRTELPGGSQQQYVLQRQDISNLDSFTSQCSISAGSFSSSGPTYAQAQQQQQQQMYFSAAYSDPSYYFEPGHAEGVSAVGVAGGSGQAFVPVSLAFEAQGVAAVAGQPLGQLPGSLVQAAVPGHAAAAAAGQPLVVLQPCAAGSAVDMGLAGAAAVGSSTGRHSLDMASALGTVAVAQQQVAAQPQQQQTGLAQLQQLQQLQ